MYNHPSGCADNERCHNDAAIFTYMRVVKRCIFKYIIRFVGRCIFYNVCGRNSIYNVKYLYKSYTGKIKHSINTEEIDLAVSSLIITNSMTP